MELIKQLLGRLHPVIVHLPIGFIILGLLLQWYDHKKKKYKNVIPLVFLWGGISAVLACITGYLQYLGEGFAFSTVKTHLWFGVITAIFAFAVYHRLLEPPKYAILTRLPAVSFLLALLFLISLTGHLGGSITHGEEYLVEPLPNSIKSALGFEIFEEQPITLNEDNWQEAQLYNEVIGPILNNRCVSCHNAKRAKGDLILNSMEAILAGGENGEVITPENPEDSPLYARLVLPKHHEDHMPPKDKTQPAKEEVVLIKNWILQGIPFDKSIGELGLQKDLFEPFFPQKRNEDYPDIEIVAASPDSIQSIREKGIHVLPVSKSSHFLSVSCINKPDFSNADMYLLHPIADQIAVLDLGGTRVTDAIFEKLAALPHLTILKLDHTPITGKDIDQLRHLRHLRVLNMTGTSFQRGHLPGLESLKKLRKVYLFDTGLIASENPQHLRNDSLTLEYGNYTLPELPSDSIIY